MKRPTHFLDERGGRSYVILFLICVFSFRTVDGQTYYSTGAPSNGLAGAVCAIPNDAYSLQSIASSAFTEQANLSFYYKNHYLLPEVHSLGALGLFPIKSWIIGLTAEKMGPKHYQEIKTGISLAHRIEHTALGLRANWEELNVEGFKTEHALVLEFGGIVNLSPHLNFGGAVYNFSLSKFEHKLLPVILRCGLSGYVTPSLLLSIEVEKNNYEPLFIKWAAQYELSKAFKLSIGYAYPSAQLYAGFSIAHRNVCVSYSLSWHVRLGVSQDFSIHYTLKKKTT